MPEYVILKNGDYLDDIWASNINDLRKKLIGMKPRQGDEYEVLVDLYMDPARTYALPYLGTLWKDGTVFYWKSSKKTKRAVSPTTGRLITTKAKPRTRGNSRRL